MQTIGQVVGIRLTTLIRHQSEENAQSWITGRDLICSTGEFFVVLAFRLIYKLFVFRNICTTIVFLVVLVLPTLMSAKPVKISDRGVFRGSMCSLGHIQG